MFHRRNQLYLQCIGVVRNFSVNNCIAAHSGTIAAIQHIFQQSIAQCQFLVGFTLDIDPNVRTGHLNLPAICCIRRNVFCRNGKLFIFGKIQIADLFSRIINSKAAALFGFICQNHSGNHGKQHNNGQKSRQNTLIQFVFHCQPSFRLFFNEFIGRRLQSGFL